MFLCAGAPLCAQTWQISPDNRRCPSKWGAGGDSL